MKNIYYGKKNMQKKKYYIFTNNTYIKERKVNVVSN